MEHPSEAAEAAEAAAPSAGATTPMLPKAASILVGLCLAATLGLAAFIFIDEAMTTNDELEGLGYFIAVIVALPGVLASLFLAAAAGVRKATSSDGKLLAWLGAAAAIAPVVLVAGWAVCALIANIV